MKENCIPPIRTKNYELVYGNSGKCHQLGIKMYNIEKRDLIVLGIIVVPETEYRNFL